MTTKAASSRWIAIFSSIILLLLCFLAAETWRSRWPVNEQAIKDLVGEPTPRGYYVLAPGSDQWGPEMDPVTRVQTSAWYQSPSPSVGSSTAQRLLSHDDQSTVRLSREQCETPFDLLAGDLAGRTQPVSANIVPAVTERIDIYPVVRDAPLRPFGHKGSVTSRRPLRRLGRDTEPQVPSRPRTVQRAENTPEAEERLRQMRKWPYPTDVVLALEQLKHDPLATVWALRTIQLIDDFYACDTGDTQRSAVYLTELERLVAQAVDLVNPAQSRQTWSDVTRTHYALHRRVQLWRLVHDVQSGDSVWVTGDEGQLRQALTAIEALLSESHHGADWHEYLMLDRLNELWSGRPLNASDRRLAARRVLERMSAADLTAVQRKFLASGIFQSLANQLRCWASEPIDYYQLLSLAEEYEADPTAEVGQHLADAIQQLRWSNNETAERLAEHLEWSYRNANARVSISAELIHRMLPPRAKERRRVDDQILGTPVVGNSVNERDLYVKLVPDHGNIQLGVVARGVIRSRTFSDVGPVRLHNNGNTQFEATQLLILDREGFRLPDPQSHARGNSQLTDVESDLDLVPLLGSLLRSYATQQHDESRRAARREMESKVARQAACELHRTMQQKVAEAEGKLKQRVVTPLRRLALDPVAIDLQTTDRRIVARYRLAGEDQLAAHTPRPLAPSDSWLSVQLHESSINNALTRLELGGRRMGLAELYETLMTAVAVSPSEDATVDLPDDVFITFAKDQPIRVRLDAGQVHVQMRIAELENARNWWGDFVVSTTYAPTMEEGIPALRRDSIIDLDGELSTLQRFPLRAIWNAVLPKNEPIALVGPRLRKDKRLDDLQIHQFVVIDGWLGIAVRGDNHPRQAHVRGLGEFIR